jgi:hypothetical protein
MANNDQHYLQQVAAMRAAKQQEEVNADYAQAVYGREESLRNRQEIESQATRTSDPAEREQLKDDWHYFDAEVQRCESDIQRMTPPPPPDPQAVDYLRRRQPFIQKYGQQAVQAIDLAHNHLMRSGNWKPNSPEYFQGMDTLLEMYGPSYGLRFDPNEIALTADEACKISGCSPRAYNNGVRALQRRR